MDLHGTFIIIPREELDQLKSVQQEILSLLKNSSTNVALKNMPAREFMEAINIRRSKFFELVKMNKIRVIRKQRKIYVPRTEIDRYFNDPSIQ